jgi:hypothetical protein
VTKLGTKNELGYILGPTMLSNHSFWVYIPKLPRSGSSKVFISLSRDIGRYHPMDIYLYSLDISRISIYASIGSIRWIMGVRLFHNGDIQIARKFEEIFKFRLDLLASSDRTLKEVRGQERGHSPNRIHYSTLSSGHCPPPLPGLAPR